MPDKGLYSFLYLSKFLKKEKEKIRLRRSPTSSYNILTRKQTSNCKLKIRETNCPIRFRYISNPNLFALQGTWIKPRRKRKEETRVFRDARKTTKKRSRVDSQARTDKKIPISRMNYRRKLSIDNSNSIEWGRKGSPWFRSSSTQYGETHGFIDRRLYLEAGVR